MSVALCGGAGYSFGLCWAGRTGMPKMAVRIERVDGAATARRTLKLDIDEGRPPGIAKLATILRRAGFRAVWASYVRSPGGSGWHVEIAVTPLPSREDTVALQAMLGSDPLRESCNLRRVRAIRRGARTFWMERWNTLYAPSRGE